MLKAATTRSPIVPCLTYRDAPAAIGALERLVAEPELRERLVRRGLEEAGRQTMDAQLDAIVLLLRGAAASSSR